MTCDVAWVGSVGVESLMAVVQEHSYSVQVFALRVRCPTGCQAIKSGSLELDPFLIKLYHAFIVNRFIDKAVVSKDFRLRCHECARRTLPRFFNVNELIFERAPGHRSAAVTALMFAWVGEIPARGT